MPTKPKPASRTKSGSKPKSKISNKLIAAIIIGIVAIAGIAIVFNSFAKGRKTCNIYFSPWRVETKNTSIGAKRTVVVTGYTRVKTVVCKGEKPRSNREFKKVTR